MVWFKKHVVKGKSFASRKKSPNPVEQNIPPEQLAEIIVSADLDINIDNLHAVFKQNQDIIFRSFRLGASPDTRACIIYIENMVDKAMLNNNIIKPLMFDSLNNEISIPGHKLRNIMMDSALAVSNVKEIEKLGDVVSVVLSGGVVILIEGLPEAFVIDIRLHRERSIEQPEDEILVRGPREGFAETLTSNIPLIRRHIKSPNLVFDYLNLGRITATDICITYIKGVASPSIVNEVKQRLERIDIDGVLESGYLEEYIEDNPRSPFPQVVHTERPDRLSAGLLQGRVGILTDGTPFALIVPAELATFLTSPEDYYERYFLGTAVRWIRIFSFIISLLLPSLYIAITTFHSETIPTRLLLSITAYRQGLPFPTLVEAFLMELTFEILREAGIRLPRSIGQAVSIVGALVIGQAAVQAGFVSPMMVIIVAFTGIASFAFPSYNMGVTIRLLRFPLMLLAGFLGLFGVMIGLIFINIHMASLRSFGVPYTSSIAPLHFSDLKDVLYRAPWWAMDKRPVETSKANIRRQAPGLKPSPPSSETNGGG
ncbi:MAG: spore germination protein [Chitinophagales bacterium]